MHDNKTSGAYGTAIVSLRSIARAGNPRGISARIGYSCAAGTGRDKGHEDLSRTFNTVDDLLEGFPQLKDRQGGGHRVYRSLKDPKVRVYVPWHEGSDGTIIWEPSRTARSTSSRCSRETATKDHSKDQYTVTIARTSKAVDEARYGNSVPTNSDNPEVTVTWAGLSKPHQENCPLSEVSAALGLETWDVDMALLARSELVTRVPPWKFDKNARQSIASSG